MRTTGEERTGTGRSIRRWALRGLVVTASTVALAACHQNGTEFVVDTTADTTDAVPGDGTCADSAGECSLRAAVMEANALPGVEEIVLADGATYTLSIPGTDEDAAATGDLDLTEGVVLSGDATIDAGFIDRVLDVVAPSGLVEILGPDLTRGSAPDGAALQAGGGASVFVEHAEVTANWASASAPVVVSAGTTVLWSGTFHGNAGTTSGAIAVDGGELRGQNLTISGNTGGTFETGTGAGAIAVSGGSADVRFSTITANRHGDVRVGEPPPDDTAGIVVADAGSMTLTASIVADQVLSQWCERGCEPPEPIGIDCAGTILSGGGNIESGTSCGFTAADDQQVTDPELGPLDDNGGAVLTHHPLAGSPAVDAASTCPSSDRDARGLARPYGPSCDVGAVEVIAGDDCGDPGPGADLRYCDLSGLDLSGLDLTGADLAYATLAGTDLTGADLTDADLTRSRLPDTTLAGVRSGGVTGDPAALPSAWVLVDGYLVGPRADLTGAQLAGAELRSATLTDADLTGANVDGTDLAYADLTGADLTGTNLVGALLSHATLTEAVVEGADLAGAALSAVRSGGLVGLPSALPDPWLVIDGYLVGPGPQIDGQLVGPGADLTGAQLAGADLTGATLLGADLTGADLTGADLSGLDLEGVPLVGASLADATLRDARLVSTDLDAADLTGADLTGADLGSTHLGNVELGGAELGSTNLVGVWSGGITGLPAALPPGYRIANGYLVGPGTHLYGADLGGAALSGADLTDTNLRNADLSGADLGGADLSRAYARYASFAGADLSSAQLVEADLVSADLTAARLDGAVVQDVRLDNAILLNTVLDHATLVRVVFYRADLTGASFVDTMIDTLWWWETTCPDGTSSVDNGGTCDGHLLPAAAGHDPFGSTDVIEGQTGAVRVAGWAIDPDTFGPVELHVYVDGAGTSGIWADGYRPDVAAVYPAYGSWHGFDVMLSAGAGWHQVCVFAINVGAGTHTLLRCDDAWVAGS